MLAILIGFLVYALIGNWALVFVPMILLGWLVSALSVVIRGLVGLLRRVDQ